jgi:acetyltransferase
VSRVLKAYRNVPAADADGIAVVLVRLAQLAAELPEVREIDLNPLLADEHGVIALDARVAIAPIERTRAAPSGHPRFAIRPYPREWERPAKLQDGVTVRIRPIRPEDERFYPAFLRRVSPEDMRLRFFAPVKDINHAFIARFTQLDYARAMVFVAIDNSVGEMLGVARLHADSAYERAEYAVLVRCDFKGKGLGWILMQTIIEYARSEGLRTIEGQVLKDNVTMLQMCAELGFRIATDQSDPGINLVSLDLKPDAKA